MLGEQSGELAGQTTGVRILPGDDFRYVKMEVSYQQQGTVLGIPVTDVGTFTSYERTGGQIYVEGQGMGMTSEGEGAIWKGHGVARPTGEGMALTIRFSAAFQAAPDGKLAALNSYLVVGELESRADGSLTTKIWPWQ